MEGSGYGSAHLPSPALVVFSQAAGGLSEALRIQRPFHSQVRISELKEWFFSVGFSEMLKIMDFHLAWCPDSFKFL